MDAKTILEKVKLYFADLIAPVAPADPAPAPTEPKAYELKGGGSVMIDKLEEGGIVVIDGNPALPGDLELADGTKLTVIDNGVISVVTPAAAPTEPAPEDMGTKFAAFETSANEKFAAFTAKFEAQELQMAQMSTQLKKANRVIEELMKLSQLIVEAPAAAPDAAASRNTVFVAKPELEKFREAREKMKETY